LYLWTLSQGNSVHDANDLDTSVSCRG
jgi:hypothetical protein